MSIRIDNLIAYYNRGDYDAVIKEYCANSELFDEQISLNILASSYLKLGDVKLAIKTYVRALSLDETSVSTLSNLGVALRHDNQIQKAISVFNRAIEINSKYAPAYNNLGWTMQIFGDPWEAEKNYLKAISLKENYFDASFNLANALRDQGRPEAAVHQYRRALEIHPGSVDVYNNMGIAFKDLGDRDAAIDAFTFALQKDPQKMEALQNLVNLKTFNHESEFFELITSVNVSKLTQTSQVYYQFSLAKVYEDLKYYRKSYMHYVLANDLNNSLIQYSIEVDMEMFSELRDAFNLLRHKNLSAEVKENDQRVIFIVGMPRSGTTLVEQIISMHPLVNAGGELNFFKNAAAKHVKRGSEITTEQIQDIRQVYLSKLNLAFENNGFLTDKMPLNFRFVPLLCACFPDSKIIHVKRDARATCWSNFQQHFRGDAQGYSYNLKTTVDYYNLYLDLMDLWKEYYPDRIIELNYEELTKNQELESKRLLEKIGLPWDEACLYPEKNKRSVRTASQEQVRKPVYLGSSNNWKKYQPFLNETFRDLRT